VRLVASLFISAPDRRQPLLSHALRAADSVVLEGENKNTNYCIAGRNNINVW
jgi:hypothetical protein